MSHRRPLAVLFALVILAGPGSMALAAEPGTTSGSPAPLLWAGRVVDRHGQPAPARVSAFIRPPASAIPLAGEGAAPASIPLSSGQADRDGRFELRAEAPAVPAAYGPDGWLHVMLFSEGADGSWSLATDSVRYVPAGDGLARPAWLSTLDGAERAERLRTSGGSRARTMAAMDRLEAEDQAGGDERPAVIQLGEPKAQASAAQPFGWQGPGDPYVACTARNVEDRQKAMRTISDIDVGPHWSYAIDYTNTGTTSWDVGYEQSGGNWKVAGTASFSDSHSTGFNAEYGPYPARFRETYQVRLVHAKVLWQCGSQTSPGPFYVRTVEPESWTGGTFNEGEPVIPCNPRHREPVAGRTYGWRYEGKSSKYSASAAVYGFSGQAAVTYSRSTKLGWKNHLEHARHVCGESGHPYTGRTRVAAMDE